MKKNYRHFILQTVFAALFTVSVLVCASAQADEKEYDLVILNTNDHHGALAGTKDENGVTHGGLAIESAFVKKIRAENQNVLLLDAGDITTGSSVSNMFGGEPDITAYNMMKYDAVAVGNHEFDNGMIKFAYRIFDSKFKWISANVFYGEDTLVNPYIIKNFDGLKVAVIGLTTCRTPQIAAREYFIGKNNMAASFMPEIDAASAAVKQVREAEKADIVIVCGHLGDVRESDSHVTSADLAEKVSGIDLIIDGHSHSLFTEPKICSGVPVVSAGTATKYIGKGIMKIKGGKVESFTWEPVELNDKDFPADEEITTMLKPYFDKADASLSDVIFTATAPFEFGNKLPRYQETGAGDYTADAMLNALKKRGVSADFAVINSGGIRAELPQGKITRGQIYSMLPFENNIVALTLSGADVAELFNFIGSVPQGAGAFAQVSNGVKYKITYDADGKGSISGVFINGKLIDTSRKYIVAVNDFMAGGGDGYVMLKNAESIYNSSVLVKDAFIEYVKSLNKFINPKPAGRITIIGGKQPE